MKARIVMLSAALSLTALSAAAAPSLGVPPAWQRPAMPRPMVQRPSLEAPAALVREGLNELLEFMSQQPRPTGMKLAAFLEDRVATHFDFDYMARVAVGPGYQRLSGEKRADLSQKIAQDFLATLSRHLAGYSEQRIRYFRPRGGYRGRASVTVGIAQPRGYPARLEFRLYYRDGVWKIYDVSANGNSAVSFYRRKFAGAVRMMSGPASGRV
jgi:phospholipid transport system substrate-binding protein